jgi:hypothetical protein
MKTTSGASTKSAIVISVLLLLILSLLVLLFLLYTENDAAIKVVTLFKGTQSPTEQIIPTPTKHLPTKTKITLPDIDSTLAITSTIEPTLPVEYPLSYIYEGGTIKCECHKCICVTKQDFSVRLTIEQDGVVSGIFEQYLIDFPDMDIVGDKSFIYGTVNNKKIANDIIEFNGKLSDDLNKLEVTIYFRGEDHYGKRIILLYKK